MGVSNMSEMARENIVVERLVEVVPGFSFKVPENVFLVIAAVLLVVKQNFVTVGLLDHFFPVGFVLSRRVAG